MFYYDPTYVLVLIGLALALGAQGMVRHAFSKWSEVRSVSGMRGCDAARRILDANGLGDVQIDHVRGELTDYYDPQQRVLYLSDAVYNVNSVAAIGVAAHESGHAIQDEKDYLPLRLRSNLVPVANIGSQAAIPLFVLGMIFSFRPLIQIGIACYLFAVLFYLVTLPVEFNASSRAVGILESGILPESEMNGIREVLRAAALTYVASALQAILQLARLLILSGDRRRRD